MRSFTKGYWSVLTFSSHIFFKSHHASSDDHHASSDDHHASSDGHHASSDGHHASIFEVVDGGSDKNDNFCYECNEPGSKYRMNIIFFIIVYPF